MQDVGELHTILPSEQAVSQRVDTESVRLEHIAELADIMHCLEDGFREIRQNQKQISASPDRTLEGLLAKHFQHLESSILRSLGHAPQASSSPAAPDPSSSCSHAPPPLPNVPALFGSVTIDSITSGSESPTVTYSPPKARQASPASPPRKIAPVSQPLQPRESLHSQAMKFNETHQEVLIGLTGKPKEDEDVRRQISSGDAGKKKLGFTESSQLTRSLTEKLNIKTPKFKRFEHHEAEKKSRGLEISKALTQGANEQKVKRETAIQMEALTFHGIMSRLVLNSWFDGFCAFVLVSNAVVIGIQVENAAESRSTDSTSEYIAIDAAYTLWFVLELGLRLYATGAVLFFSGEELAWNWFDLTIVSVGVVETLTSLVAQNSEASILNNLSALRTIRICRVARVARVVRLMRFFRSLRVLVKAILNTMKSCTWAALLLGMIVYIFGILFAQGVTDHFQEDQFRLYESREKDALKIYFGSLPRSILSCFKAIQGGIDWEILSNALSDLHWSYVVMFIAQIVFVNLAVLNVISGIFLHTAIEQAQNDIDDIIASHVQEQTTYVKRFESVFKEMDRDGDQRISLLEFEDSIDKPAVKDLLHAMEIEANDAWTLFKLLDIDGSGSVDIQEFVNGCLGLKGGAKGIHVAQQTYECRWMMDAFEDLVVFIDSTFKGFEHHLEDIEHHQEGLPIHTPFLQSPPESHQEPGSPRSQHSNPESIQILTASRDLA